MRNLPQEITLIDAALEITAAKGDSKIPGFSLLAYTGKKMRPKGFEEDVVVDLAGLTAKDKVPVRMEHDAGRTVGHTEGVLNDGKTLTASGLISRQNKDSDDLVASGKSGFPWQASVGLNNMNGQFVKAGESRTINGQTHEGPFIHVMTAKLKEISVVESGADDDTLTQIAASAAQEKQEMSEPAKVDEPVKITTAAPVTEPKSLEASDDTPAFIQQARAEKARKSKINDIARETLQAGADVDAVEEFRIQAIEAGSNPNEFKQEMLRLKFPVKGPSIGPSKKDLTNEVMEAAICITGGLEGVEKRYSEQTLNEASRAFPQGLSASESMFQVARLNGFTGSARDVRGMLEHAFPRGLQAAAGFSTISLPGIFSNVANKFSLEGFFAVENSWDQIASIGNARDFKEITSYRLTGSGDYELVPPGGELKHGTLGEEVYRNKVDTYGKILSITRQDIINDDLDALTAVPRRLGRDGALKLNQILWNVFTDDSAFFPTDGSNGNYIEGAATLLSVDGLSELDAKFREQVDGDGNPLLLIPRILLVPAALRILAMQLMNSTEIRGGTGKQATMNPHAGAYKLVESQYLNVASKTAFYLLANPGELAALEVRFLNGQRTPVVETADADFDTLGVKMRSYFDFGVRKQDFRAACKSKGAA